MKIFQDLPIRIQLTAILVIMGVLPMILVGYTANRTASNSIESSTLENLQNTTKLLAISMNQTFGRGEEILREIRADQNLLEAMQVGLANTEDEASQSSIRNFLFRILYFQRIFQFAALSNSPGNYIREGVKSSFDLQLEELSFFQDPEISYLGAQEGLSQWISGYRGDYDNIILATGLHEPDTEEYIAHLFLGIRESYFSNFFSSGFSSSHNVIIFDENGRIISSQDGLLRGTQIQGLPENFAEARAQQIGYTLEDRFFSWSPLITGWYVGIQVPTDIWMRDIYNQGRFITIFIIFCVLFTLSLSFLFSYQFSKPLLEIQKKIYLASFGTYDIRVPVISGSELGKLGENFNRLMQYLEKEKTLRLEAEGTLSRLNHRLDLRVRERTRELEKSMEDLTMAQERLIQTEKMAALGGLVAGVAHEINTPLGISTTAASYIKDIADKLQKKFESGSMKKSDLDRFLEDTSDSVDIILYNLSRSGDIIKDFKNVAVGKTLEDYTRIDLKEFFQEVIQSISPRFASAKPEFEFFIQDKLMIQSDPKQLHQVFSNLFYNAFIHGFDQQPGGKITIRGGRKDGQIWIEVQDNGKGMRPDQKAKAFNPFYTTRRGQGGTGLGLHIVYNIIVSSLKGNISLESVLDKGSIFRLTLPDLD